MLPRLTRRAGATFSPSSLPGLAAWWAADSLTANDGDAIGSMPMRSSLL